MNETYSIASNIFFAKKIMVYKKKLKMNVLKYKSSTIKLFFFIENVVRCVLNSFLQGGKAFSHSGTKPHTSGSRQCWKSHEGENGG